MEQRATTDEIRGELRETFVSELDERLASMNDALLALESGNGSVSPRRLIESLFRDAHTLKGGAQLIEWDEVASLTHALESLLGELRDAPTVPAHDLQSIFATVDALASASREGALSGKSVTALIDRLGARSLQAQATLELARDDAETGTPPARAEVAASAEPAVQPKATSQTGGRPRMIPVATDRLDRLLSRAGELLAARESSRRRRQRLGRLAEEASGWHQQWLAARTAAREASRTRHEPAPNNPFLAEPMERIAEQADALVRGVRALAAESHVADQELGQLVDQLEAELHDLRMVPARRLFRQFPRMVRDLATQLGKSAELEAIGWDTPIDRELIDRLREPILHLLRNAVDHGIEAAEERRRIGKSPVGRITIEAALRGGGISISVRDDGAGIDRDRVVERAQEAGLIERSGAQADPIQLLFAAGLSTAVDATRVSGRGVGLDVVAAAVTSLRGSIRVASSQESGTTFTLQLPLSLASTRVLVIGAGGERYGIRVEDVARLEAADSERMTLVGGRRCLDSAGRPVVAVELASLLGASSTGTTPSLAVLLDRPEGRSALLVDDVFHEREVVLKELGDVLGQVPLILGAAVTDRDTVLPVLDAAALIGRISEGDVLPARTKKRAPSEAERPLRILVIDDSLTTRTLERNILAAAGFDVVLAADGREGLTLLGLERVDIVVSDVDMPGIDGVELTRRIRASEQLRDIPVILVTAKERPEDRERGLHAGADVYLAKSEFDHNALLTTIRELVG